MLTRVFSTENDRKHYISVVSDKKSGRFTLGKKGFTSKSEQLTFGKKIVTFGLFSLKKGRCSNSNLMVSLLKIVLCLRECFHQKMMKIVTIQ